MTRFFFALGSATSAAALLWAFYTCAPLRTPQSAYAPHITPAGNITLDSCELQVGWGNASAILRFSTSEHLGEVVLVDENGNATRAKAHCHTEAPGIWRAEWGANEIRVFANGHAEGTVRGQKVAFAPLGNGECLGE